MLVNASHRFMVLLLVIVLAARVGWTQAGELGGAAPIDFLPASINAYLEIDFSQTRDYPAVDQLFRRRFAGDPLRLERLRALGITQTSQLNRFVGAYAVRKDGGSSDIVILEPTGSYPGLDTVAVESERFVEFFTPIEELEFKGFELLHLEGGKRGQILLEQEGLLLIADRDALTSMLRARESGETIADTPLYQKMLERSSRDAAALFYMKDFSVYIPLLGKFSGTNYEGFVSLKPSGSSGAFRMIFPNATSAEKARNELPFLPKNDEERNKFGLEALYSSAQVDVMDNIVIVEFGLNAPETHAVLATFCLATALWADPATREAIVPPYF